MIMAATGLATVLLYCDDPECCEAPLPVTDLIPIQGVTLCPHHALEAAAEAAGTMLSPHWTPTPTGLRNAEEGVVVLRQLLARIEARIRIERTKEIR